MRAFHIVYTGRLKLLRRRRVLSCTISSSRYLLTRYQVRLSLCRNKFCNFPSATFYSRGPVLSGVRPCTVVLVLDWHIAVLCPPRSSGVRSSSSSCSSFFHGVCQSRRRLDTKTLKRNRCKRTKIRELDRAVSERKKKRKRKKH